MPKSSTTTGPDTSQNAPGCDVSPLCEVCRLPTLQGCVNGILELSEGRFSCKNAETIARRKAKMGDINRIWPVPLKYREIRLEVPQPSDVGQAMTAIFDLGLGHPMNDVVIKGSNRTSRAMVAAGLWGYAVDCGLTSIFVEVPKMLSAFKATWDKSDGDRLSEAELKKMLIECDLLLLDNLGGHKATPWAEELIEELQYSRFCELRPTVYSIGRPGNQVFTSAQSREILENVTVINVQSKNRKGNK